MGMYTIFVPTHPSVNTSTWPIWEKTDFFLLWFLSEVESQFLIIYFNFWMIDRCTTYHLNLIHIISSSDDSANWNWNLAAGVEGMTLLLSTFLELLRDALVIGVEGIVDVSMSSLFVLADNLWGVEDVSGTGGSCSSSSSLLRSSPVFSCCCVVQHHFIILISHVWNYAFFSETRES